LLGKFLKKKNSKFLAGYCPRLQPKVPQAAPWAAWAAHYFLNEQLNSAKTLQINRE